MLSFCPEPKGGVADPSAEDSWISEVEKPLFEESIDGSDPNRGVVIHGSSIGSGGFGTGQSIDPVPVEKC